MDKKINERFQFSPLKPTIWYYISESLERTDLKSFPLQHSLEIYEVCTKTKIAFLRTFTRNNQTFTHEVQHNPVETSVARLTDKSCQT